MIVNMLEDIAHISPNCISPEKDFGVKVEGIDFLIVLNNKIIQCQLKSNKDTLTGAQASRSKEELLIYDNPHFAAAFDTDTSWHLSHPDITRVCGKEFWDLIFIPYETLLECLGVFISQIEKHLFPDESFLKKIKSIFNITIPIIRRYVWRNNEIRYAPYI